MNPSCLKKKFFLKSTFFKLESKSLLIFICLISGIFSGNANGFDLLAVNSNRIIANLADLACPTSAGTLSGNQYLCTYGNNTTTFSSTVSGGTWSSSNTSIATINVSTGFINSLSAGTVTITYTVGGGSCSTFTATRNLYIASGPGPGPTSLSGSNSQNTNSTATYTITPDDYSSSYQWYYSGNGVTFNIAPNGLSAIATFSTSATSGNINVQSINGCGNGGGGKYIWVAVSNTGGQNPTGGTINNGTSPICLGSSTSMNLSGSDGTILRWEKRLLPETTWTNIANTTTSLSDSPLSSGTWEYRAVVEKLGYPIVYSGTKQIIVDPVSIGGNISGGNSPICLGSSTGTLSLTGNTGNINWQYQVNSGGWNDTGNNSTTYSMTPWSSGTWEFRSKVQSGNCTVAYSNIKIITVNQNPIAGGIYDGTTPICLGVSTTMTLSGSSGVIIHWEKKLSTSPTWTIITNSTTSLSDTPSNSGTWDYRALVGNGSCTSVYSNIKQIVVEPSIPDPVTRAADIYNCSSAGLLWSQAGATETYLDVSTNSDFSTFVPGYNSLALSYQTNRNFNGVAGTYYYRVRAYKNNCPTTSNYSNVTSFTLGSVTGTASSNQSICIGSSPSNITLANYAGNIQWYSSTNNSTFTAISGATSSILSSSQMGTLSTTTYYKALVTKVLSGGETCSSAYSNTVTVVATAQVTTPTTPTPSATSICQGSAPTTYTTTSNATSYNWTVTGTGNTISGTGKTATVTWDANFNGIATVSVSANGCATTAIASTTVTVNAKPTVTNNTLNYTICSNERLNIPLTASEASTFTWAATSNTNVTGESTNSQTTSSITNKLTNNTSTPQNVTYSITATSTSGGCMSALKTIVVTINPAPTKPSIVSLVQPTCLAPTGSITLNATNGIEYSINGVNYFSDITKTFSGLAPNIYNIRTRTGANSCDFVALTFEIIAQVTNKWDGTAWSNGTPIITDTVEFNGDYTQTEDFQACSCTVNSGDIVFAPDKTITISNGVHILGGSLTLENNASLVQINDVQNTGNITYKRIAENIKGQDYIYWSSPVSGQNLNTIYTTPAQGQKYFWNTTVNNGNGNENKISQGNWESASNAIMQAGRGYIVRGSSNVNLSATNINTTFTGVPNNGDILVDIERGSYTGNSYQGLNGTFITNIDDNWNLIGNPYPSAINALQFLSDNSATILGNVRLWKHGIGISRNGEKPFYGSFTYNYSADDYEVINYTGSTTPGFSEIIKTGQAFFVQMIDGPTATAKVTFNNGQRSNSYSNNNFFRVSNNKNSELTLERNRIWLDIVSADNTSSGTLIGYVEGATMDNDSNFDAYEEPVGDLRILSKINENSFTIQGRALPFNSEDIVPLVVVTPNAGIYKIAIRKVDGLFENAMQHIYLEDKKLGTIHDLKLSAYSFSSNQGIDKNRFFLRYTNSISNLDLPTFNKNDNVFAYSDDNVWVKSMDTNIKNIVVYDVLGKKIDHYENIDANEIKLQNLMPRNNIFILKITLENDKIINKKIIF